MNMATLIANSGIQMMTFRITLDRNLRFKKMYHEWQDAANNLWYLEPVYELQTDGESLYYRKIELVKNGYFASGQSGFTQADLSEDNIFPIENSAAIYSMSLDDRSQMLSHFENVWLPIPYFKKRERRVDFGPINWSRIKLIPINDENGAKTYDVILAFDTRAKYGTDDNTNECPVFSDEHLQEIDYELCAKDDLLMDFCNTNYIDDYLFHLVYPELNSQSQIRGQARRMSYIAYYCTLVSYLVGNSAFPTIKLYRNREVEVKPVDMVVDIGNSRTTALLLENPENLNETRRLELINFTDILEQKEDETIIRRHADSFDMRLAFRKVNFGDIGMKNSRQFVYPSLVRLGQEAYSLVLRNIDSGENYLSTSSSPKRYLWDKHASREEWQFLRLEGESGENRILSLNGITNQIRNDGTIDPNGNGESSHNYSRRSLMTLAFLEMLAQATIQINGESHRSIENGFGNPSLPRELKRIIVTCPTAMSKEERNALIHCAEDAVALLNNFEESNRKIEVVPSMRAIQSACGYDEATCSQLVYINGEIGYKYNGRCEEYFRLYGKNTANSEKPTLTIGSLDIGAGTSDLMINEYTYSIDKNGTNTLKPTPKFYDSYYIAGDDMLRTLITNVMLGEKSAFRATLKNLSVGDYRQKIKNFFGNDYGGQTMGDRILRRDFNIQYSVPLMCHFLELLKNESADCEVKYKDVFAVNAPNNSIIEKFYHKFGVDITKLNWKFNKKEVSEEVRKAFEPLLSKIATIMYAYACDVILLSGRPASLAAIRTIFLKHFPVSPNRLIVLNNHYVGDWYPIGENTGYIQDAKTIVAMGGILRHYISGISSLNNFLIDFSPLENIKSTANFINLKDSVNHIITPNQNSGEFVLTAIPATLNASQLALNSYYSRPLYVIDFDNEKIGNLIRDEYRRKEEQIPTDAHLRQLVKDKTDALKREMPFTFVIEKDVDDNEKLSIVSVLNSVGNEISTVYFDIHIQSLGGTDKYWLDSGIFNVQ